ncbi:unnamed protein product [Gongylonema pulchrum]|uniref:2-(3-amino-3-carboxypropyl)histidine synthase subunit 1 n=1 Tax=Gongylonema pulchrum TaxID=637853 RepID=A0A183E5K9_9BILA|nr:unnamed protein product [Gongylonema pulchrum]
MRRAAVLRNEIAEISNDEALKNDLKVVSICINLRKTSNQPTFSKILSHSLGIDIALKVKQRNDCGDLHLTVALGITDVEISTKFPEGLLLYSCVIADILRKYTKCEIIIMGDVTYGACCVGDQAARALDKKHALVSTIQFVPSLQSIKKELNADGYNILVPQVKPLSPGEILGCTSPRLPNDVDAIIYLGDGRFHLESVMIQNPSICAYQYDPYSKRFTHEKYDFNLMANRRNEAVQAAKKCHMFGLIQGSLGRQGNPKIVQELERRLQLAGKMFVRILLSEITPEKLSYFKDIDW